MADPSDYHSSKETPRQVTMAASDWASLEIGMVQQIAARLSAAADRVRVGHVCRRWRSAVSGDRGVMGRPWILARRGRRRCWRSHAFMRLSHLHEDVSAFGTGAAAFPPAGVDVLGASRGWLAVRQGDRVVLTDVVSPANLSLPPFLPGYRIKNIFLSGDPFAAPAWTAFAIAAVPNSSKDDVALAFFRRGDTRWALVHGDDVHAHPGRRYTSVEFHGGRAYAVDDMRREMVCVDDGAAAAAIVTARTRIPQPLGDSYSACKTMQSSMAWLVECAGDLLLVQLEHSLPRLRGCLCCACSPRRPLPGYLGLHLQVWRLRLEEDGVPASFLRTSMDIGDHALFVGDLGHAFAVQASGGLAGVRRNSVYYAGRMADTVVVFDIDTYRYEAVPCSRRRGASVMGKWRPFCWVCPHRPVAACQAAEVLGALYEVDSVCV